MEELNLMIKAQKMGRKKQQHLQQKQLFPAVKNLCQASLHFCITAKDAET